MRATYRTHTRGRDTAECGSRGPKVYVEHASAGLGRAWPSPSPHVDFTPPPSWPRRLFIRRRAAVLLLFLRSWLAACLPCLCACVLVFAFSRLGGFAW
eukprot:1359996-Prymnesium_polylepis.1